MQFLGRRISRAETNEIDVQAHFKIQEISLPQSNIRKPEALFLCKKSHRTIEVIRTRHVHQSVWVILEIIHSHVEATHY